MFSSLVLARACVYPESEAIARADIVLTLTTSPGRSTDGTRVGLEPRLGSNAVGSSSLMCDADAYFSWRGYGTRRMLCIYIDLTLVDGDL